MTDSREKVGHLTLTCLDRAADNGVELCLEVVNRYESNLLNTAAQVRP